jgi:zinc D-Ala-D-Ala carboxypeptidase
VNSSEHFSEKELACRCGCGEGVMDERLLELLEAIRVEYGKPMVISSAYRCPTWNAAVSSTGRVGPHTTGKAVDVLCRGKDAHQLLAIALEEGVPGIGVFQRGVHRKRFLHFDVIEGVGRPYIWSY